MHVNLQKSEFIDILARDVELCSFVLLLLLLLLITLSIHVFIRTMRIVSSSARLDKTAASETSCLMLQSHERCSLLGLAVIKFANAYSAE